MARNKPTNAGSATIGISAQFPTNWIHCPNCGWWPDQATHDTYFDEFGNPGSCFTRRQAELADELGRQADYETDWDT
jgi:hypothetical protein